METCTISQLWSKLNKQPEKNPHYIPLRNPQCQGSVFDVKFNLDHGLYFNWNWTVVVVVVVGCWWRGGDLNSSKNRWSLALAAIKTNWLLLKWSTCKLYNRMSKSSLKMLTILNDCPEYWDVSDRQQSQPIMNSWLGGLEMWHRHWERKLPGFYWGLYNILNILWKLRHSSIQTGHNSITSRMSLQLQQYSWPTETHL